MAFPCRVNVTDLTVEVIKGAVSAAEWNFYAVMVQRDAMIETKHLSRWQHLRPSSTQVKDQSSAPATQLHVDGLLQRLDWAPCNQASFVIDFRRSTNSQPNAAVDYVNSDEGVVKKVLPKTNHQLAVSVIARKVQPGGGCELRNGSFTTAADKAPVTPVTTFDPSSPFLSPTVEGKYGHFVCSMTIDPTEAYNAPSGRLEYRLQLKDQDITRGSQQGHYIGTPKFVNFTVVAERQVAKPTRLLRNFHDYVILLDQFFLDATTATRRDLEYGFGFFTDVSNGIDRKKLTHYTREFKKAQLMPDGTSMFVDFTGHVTHDETGAAARNPVDVAIVSSESTSYSNVLVGRRTISTSRFKTDECEQLCKSSMKCTLVLAFLWRAPDASIQEAIMEALPSQKIDLAKEILNVEDFPDDGVVRCVASSYGERLYFRLRRRCFEGPRFYGTPLLEVTEEGEKAPAVQSSAAAQSQAPPMPVMSVVELSDDECPASLPPRFSPVD